MKPDNKYRSTGCDEGGEFAARDQAIDNILRRLKITSCTEETKEIKEIKELEEVDDVGESVWREINEEINSCRLPTFHTFNKYGFKLARRIRGIEERTKHRFSSSLLHKIFKTWESENSSYLQPDTDYFAEFLEKYLSVKQPWGPQLAAALEKAHDTPTPKKALLLDPKAHLLAKLCRELNSIAAGSPFVLDGRSAAKLLHCPHRTVATWLKALIKLGVLICVEKGRTGRASRYIYISKD